MCPRRRGVLAPHRILPQTRSPSGALESSPGVLKGPTDTGLRKQAPVTPTNINAKSLESWIWDAACSIRGAKDAPKYKDYVLPLIFTKRLCDVFDDELNRIAAEVGFAKEGLPARQGRPQARPLIRRGRLPRQILRRLGRGRGRSAGCEQGLAGDSQAVGDLTADDADERR